MDELYCYESGQAGMPAVVFLHGGGLSGKSWQPQMERMAGWHCLAPDLPGQGLSQAIRPFDLDDTAARIESLIRSKVPAGRAHAVGLSLGGAVALTVAGRFPACLDRIMISGSAAGLGRFIARLSVALLGLYKNTNPQKLAESAIRQFGISEEYRALVYEDLVRSSDTGLNREFLEALMNMHLPVRLENPMLVTVGELETGEAKKAARKLARLYPQVKTALVPRMRHAWNLQDPDLFTRVLVDWLEKGQAPDGLASV